MLGGAHSLGSLILLVSASSSGAIAGVFGRRGKWTSRRGPSQGVKPSDGGEDWQQTQGSVAAGRLVWNHVEISYEFTVEGKRYQGKHEIRLSPVNPEDLYPELARRHEVNALLHRYARGTVVLVRYNPANPEQSILFESEGTQAKGAGAG